MKKCILSLALILTAVTAAAVPAKRGLWKTVTTEDGRQVRVELRGDEFGHYWQSADGEKLVENTATGLFMKADMVQIRQNVSLRRAAMAKAAPRRSMGVAPSKVEYTGKKKGLIILVNFKDTKFKAADSVGLYREIANTIGYTNPEMGFKGSVKDYFLAQSSGRMEFDFDIAGPVTMPYSYKYYGMNDSKSGGDMVDRVGKMIVNACKGVDDQIDFSKYDWDGDGEVEQVFILYAGKGEASYPYDTYLIWPHMYYISAATGSALTLDGVKVDTYACSNELGATGKIDGIGTICHEFSHCLGLPDFYDTSYSGYYGTGDYDLMCSGSYNGDSFSPANYTAYERMWAGWLDPVELKKDTVVTDLKSLSDAQDAYIIYNENDKDEYYMLENRQLKGWDAGLPGSGLLITHIDYDKRIWDANCPNDPGQQKQLGISNTHERYAVIPAGHIVVSIYDTQALPYPYNGLDSLTNTSDPAAILYNANLDGSKLLNKKVTDITRNSDGTVAFNFYDDMPDSIDYDLPESYLFYESFDKCGGVGGNDGVFNGSNVGKGTFSGRTDNTGWKSTSPHAANKCAMFGSKLVGGDATTPAIKLDGECRLLFKAVPYTSDGDTLTLRVEDGDAELSDTIIVMKDTRWTAYEVKVTGTGDVKLSFNSPGRFFLDKVCVASDTPSGIMNNATVARPRPADGLVYTLDGRCLGRNVTGLRKGIYIINGKKVVK